MACSAALSVCMAATPPSLTSLAALTFVLLVLHHIWGAGGAQSSISILSFFHTHSQIPAVVQSSRGPGYDTRVAGG
eukprot:212721-Pelagomonas_calceolata.AAC.5